MKQFLLFAGDFYYPSGGWEDYVGDFDSQEQAIAHAATISCDWWQIVHPPIIVQEGSKKWLDSQRS